MSSKAIIAFKHKFGSAQVTLDKDDTAPFTPGRRLGGGGDGIVHETKLDDIPLALKRTYTRTLSKQHLNEIKILSGKHHRHVVELVGSYVQRQRGVYEIGLLIYPVAHCDLSMYLHALDTLSSWVIGGRATRHLLESEIGMAIDTLSVFQITPIRMGRAWRPLHGPWDHEKLFEACRQRLCGSFACIAEAVAYLHRQSIRHKDLKPSQILLSPGGLWLTDFGWSVDTAALSTSATNNGHFTTYRYQAPERAAHRSCGRAEDIFGLGCIFLEMSARLLRNSGAITTNWTSPVGEKWSFQADLDSVETWTASLFSTNDLVLSYLATLIKDMMANEAVKRPTIEVVIEWLSYHSVAGIVEKSHWKGFIDTCCVPIENPVQSSTYVINEQSHGNIRAEKATTHAQSTPPQNTSQSSKAVIPRMFKRGGRSTFEWICCQCGRGGVPISNSGCPNCGYGRCAYCKTIRR